MGSAELNDVCTFNKDFTRLERYFKIEILVKGCSPNEISIIDKRRIVILECTSPLNSQLR